MAYDIENSTFHDFLMFLALEASISSIYWTELLELNQEKSRNILESWENKVGRNLKLKNFEILET